MPLSIGKKKSVVGLDIGYHEVCVVEVERKGQGWSLAGVGSAPTPEGSIKDGAVVDPPAVAAAIRQAMREGGISCNAVNIAVGGGTVVVRNVRMPLMNEAVLQRSIKFEASRYLPNNVEDSYVEFEIIGHTEDNQMDVLIVAAPRDLVSSRIEACQIAGVEVESVDLEIFAAYRSLVEADEQHEWDQKTIAIVDIGASKTNMAVVQNGVFTMTRSIPQGGKTLTDALKSYFKLDINEAELGKAQLDLGELLSDTPRENPPLRVIQPHLDDLVREVRRSLNYYQAQSAEQQRDGNVDAVLLTGGGSRIGGIEHYFMNKLGIHVDSIGALMNPRFGSNDESAFGSGLSLSVGIGLAMRAHLNGAKGKAA